MNRFLITISAFFLCYASIAQNNNNVFGVNENERNFRFRGYLKEMPSLEFNNINDDIHFNNIVHNRLNFSYEHNRNLNFVFEVRNRLLTGNMVNDYNALMIESLKNDNGFFDASFVPLSGDKYIWHLNPDRFYIDWRNNNWQVRLGRQRINWGINTVSNPNDLFNNYSFFDFDYEERPGADALRIQHYTGDMSRLEFALSPGRELEKSVAAMMYAFNTNAYDIQLVAGYYRERTALGAGWAGNIKTSGFKGEATLFNSIDKMDSMTIVAAVSFDHLFGNGIYGFVEMLYNGGHTANTANLLMMTEPMTADNIFISKYAITGSVMYPISPILSASAAAMYMPDMDAWYVMPSLSWSVASNFDLQLLMQVFQLENEASRLRAANAYLQLKWSF